MPDWLADHAALSAADREHGLPAEDLERLAVAAFLIGHDDQVVPLRERALQQYLERGQLAQAVQCGFWCAFYLQNRGEIAQSQGWASRLRRLIPAADIRLNGMMLQPMAATRMFAGDPVAALELFEQSAEIADRWADLDFFALAFTGKARCLQMLGREDECVLALDEAMVHVVGGRVQPQVTGLVYCAAVDLCMGRYDLARAQEWTQALTGWVNDQIGMLPYRGNCLVHRAEILQLRGAWAEAAAQAERACDHLSGSGEYALAAAHYRVAELSRLRGRVDAAELGYQRAAEAGYEVQPGLALLRLAQGRAAAGLAGLRRVLAESSDSRIRPLLLAAQIEICLTIDDLDTSRKASEALQGVAESGSAPFVLALAEHCAGAVLLAQSAPGQSLPRLRRAWSLWQQVDAPYEAARTRLLVAQACRQLGDDDAAGMEADAARAAFERLGALADLIRLDAELARLDATQNPRGPLTLRELEVLRLLATGATNRAIAQHLILSEKTVARHVSNIFGKLDLNTRAAATAYAFEHRLA